MKCDSVIKQKKKKEFFVEILKTQNIETNGIDTVHAVT